MMVPHAERSSRGGGESRPVRLAVLGSTGSIGTQTLDLARRYPGKFEITALAAGSNSELLAQQVNEFKPRYAVLGGGNVTPALRKACADARCELSAGDTAITELAGSDECDVVVAAIVGVAGMLSVLRAAERGKRIALANKEALVAGGKLVQDAQQRSGAEIVPVDSEHSAIFQALRGDHVRDIAALVLTASGGPFLDTPFDEFKDIRPEHAVKHPKWRMGAKISVDSATLMNKALELIEAHWLFGVPADRIEVVVHPQSIVHSLVRLTDGALLAQLSEPDMRGPIAFALNYPNGRLEGVMPRCDLTEIGSLEFRALDDRKFPAVSLARRCLEAGGGAAAVFNVANEVAVARFLAGALRFDEIVPVVEGSLERFAGRDYATVEELLELIAEVREEAQVRTEGA